MGVLAGLPDVIDANSAALNKPGVLAVRPGYIEKNGWPTKDPAVVVVKEQGAADPPVPAVVNGVPVQVRVATDVEQYAANNPSNFARAVLTRPEARLDAFAPAASFEAAVPQVLAAKPSLPYSGPDGVTLQPVTGQSPFTVHASPDAGWPTLEAFLKATKNELVVGMYDFTSKHILDTVDAALAGAGKAFTMTLDNPAPNPSRDQLDSETVTTLHDDLGASFKAAWALNRMNSAVKKFIFPSAYHIKVAVRDGDTVWLSSGNWNNSNQPDFDPIGDSQGDAADQDTARASDRDWHVIIEDANLAGQFRAYLLNDYTVAEDVAQAGGAPLPFAAQPDFALAAAKPTGSFTFHAPKRITGETSTITPLLTPDPGVYQKAMLALIDAVQTSLYIQLQYIHPSNNDADQAFNDLIDAVKTKIDAGLDVRIIVSQWQVPGGWLDRLQAAGISLDVVKIQKGVHNKGFIFDHKIVALGSQNWSGDGVLRNRDASVIIDNATAAAYFETIFLGDWDNIAQKQT